MAGQENNATDRSKNIVNKVLDNALDDLYSLVRPTQKESRPSQLGLYSNRQGDYDHLYADNRFFQNMVNLIPQDANTCFPKINNTEYNTDATKVLRNLTCIGEPMEEIDVLGAFTLAGIYGRLYSDGFIFLNIDDGLPNSEPLDLSKVRSIQSLMVKDRHHVALDWSKNIIRAFRNYADRLPGNFGDGMQSGNIIFEEYHYTRVIRLVGISEHGRQYFSSGYNRSVIDGVYNSYMRYFSALRDSGDMLSTHSAFKYGLKGLSQITQFGKDSYVKQRFKNLIDGLSAFKGLVFDAQTESAEYIQRSYSGVDSLLDHLQDWMVANSGMPRNKVFGNAAANALSEGSEGDRRAWNEIIARYQHEQLRLGYRKLISVVLASLGHLDEDFDLEFEPYYKLSKLELGDFRQKIAASDKLYHDMGLPLEYILQNRFGSGNYSHDMDLTTEEIKEIIAKKEEQKEQMMQSQEPNLSEEKEENESQTEE